MKVSLYSCIEGVYRGQGQVFTEVKTQTMSMKFEEKANMEVPTGIWSRDRVSVEFRTFCLDEDHN